MMRYGIAGGGGGAFFGSVHRRAIQLAGSQVVAGVLSGDPDRAMKYARDWGIRGYPTLEEMLLGERRRQDGVEAVVIATPNNFHFEQAKLCLGIGYPVFCEKPMTLTIEQALKLEQTQDTTGLPFGVAYTYTGHWTLRLARHIVSSGVLGRLRRVEATYLQDWLANPIERDGQKQAMWRTDPACSGVGGCLGDIASHALQAVRFVTGLEVEAVRAFLTSFVPERRVDDDCLAICKMDDPLPLVVIKASQVTIGHMNDHTLEVNCEHGSLIWHQEMPEELVVCLTGYPILHYRRGTLEPCDPILGTLPPDLLAESTLPGGHGEAFHDALARLHRCFAQDVKHYGQTGSATGTGYPTVSDGVAGMKFIHACYQSNLHDHTLLGLDEVSSSEAILRR